MCISGCPYKKIYYNWQSGKAEKCTFCYPRIEAGQPTVCSETCVGRIRYLGVMLYDADQIERAAAVASEQDLYQSQLDLFLDPHSPEVIAAREQGIPESWLEAARKSPVYKMAVQWRVAFPLHPEYRTLPMVWYIPPLSPIQTAAESGKMPTRTVGKSAMIPDVQPAHPRALPGQPADGGQGRAGAAGAGAHAGHARHKRSETVHGERDSELLARVGLDDATVQDMYRIMAIADYEDRFVVPGSHKEMVEDSFNEKGSCFTFGNGCGRRVRGLAVRQEAAGQRDLHRHAQVRKKAAAA